MICVDNVGSVDQPYVVNGYRAALHGIKNPQSVRSHTCRVISHRTAQVKGMPWSGADPAAPREYSLGNRIGKNFKAVVPQTIEFVKRHYLEASSAAFFLM